VNQVGTLEECDAIFRTFASISSRESSSHFFFLSAIASDLRIVFKRYATIGPKKDEIDEDNFAKVRGIISFRRDPPHFTHFFIIEDGREVGCKSERTSIA
jgi:hypothetical protein